MLCPIGGREGADVYVDVGVTEGGRVWEGKEEGTEGKLE